MAFKDAVQLLGSWIITLLLISIIILSQAAYDRYAGNFEKERFRFVIRAKTIMPPEVVKHISFGFRTALADYYWIRAVQDFTGWNYIDDFYLGYFKNITVLDPQFSYPYLFAIFSIPNDKDLSSVDKVVPIAELGMKVFEDNWELPFYLGTAYNLYTKDNAKTEYYLALAASKKSAPPLVTSVYSGFVTKKLVGRDGRIALMQTIRDTTTNETIKELAAKGVVVEEIKKMLEQGIIAYKAKYNRYPKTLEELTSQNFISQAEGIGTLFNVEINQQNGTFKLIEK